MQRVMLLKKMKKVMLKKMKKVMLKKVISRLSLIGYLFDTIIVASILKKKTEVA